MRLPFLALLLTACSSPEEVVIDGSSPENFAATAGRAREQLAAGDRLTFDKSLGSVGGRLHSADADQLRRTTFDGMTGTQVVEDFERRQR